MHTVFVDATSRELAKAFARNLFDCTTLSEMREIVRKNATPEYANACASQDILDANELMILAAHECGARLCTEFRDGTPEFEAACQRWNEAWHIARSEFFPLMAESDPPDVIF